MSNIATGPDTNALSKDAVKILVGGGEPPVGSDSGGLVVKLLNIRPRSNANSRLSTAGADRFRPCQICDEEHFVDGMVYLSRLGESHIGGRDGDVRSCTVRVKGYVTSKANYNRRGMSGSGSSSPCVPVFVCITSFTLLSSSDNHKNAQSQCNMKMNRLPSATKVVGGKVGTYFEEVAPWLSDEELSGLKTCGVFGTETNKTAISSIANFLVNHQAMTTISRNSNSVATAATGGGDGNQISNYTAAIKDFEDSQLKRQMASLTSNAGREDASRSEKVVDRYSIALSMALEHAKSPNRQQLTTELICAWHKELGGDGLVEGAGCIRKKQVRAGTTSFTHKNYVEDELKKFLIGLRDMEFRLIRSGGAMDMPTHTDDGNCTKQGYGPILFAASALFGINDIHPFVDGNGRLSRILGNWALARAGFPFVVNFFATPQQRTIYVQTIEVTRRNIMLVPHGQVFPDIFSIIRRLVGPLKPIMDHILDKVYKATVECEKVIASYSAKEVEDLDARAAKRFREKVANEPCIICYDLQANIATLCCGKPLHLNCIAQWLSTSSTCPQCRCNFPQLPPRAPAPAPQPVSIQNDPVMQEDLDSLGDTTTVDIDDDSTTNLDTASTVENSSTEVEEIHMEYDDTTSVANDSLEDDTTTTVIDEDTTDDTTEIASEEDATTTVDEDTTTTADGDVNDDTTDESSTTGSEVPSSRPRFSETCNFDGCRNKAAVDCANTACGRCCQIYGSFACARHSV